MKPYILPLTDLHADLDTVGGKGMSLAKLADSGFAVPEGFHITTHAYLHFVSTNQLQDAINQTLKEVDLSKPTSFDAVSQKIGHLFSQSKIPGALANAIVSAYAALPGSNPAVAVRSSATAEDLPEASFAGQQETYLNITGADQLLEATKKCWASLWTARAIAYRSRQNIPPEKIALAVTVQLLVNAEAAGILFTANPLNGNREEMLINAAWGLGEAIVSGAVDPDIIKINKSTGEIIQRHTSEKRVMSVCTRTGIDEKPVPDNLRNIPVLSDTKAHELSQIGIQIEELYRLPMDIEWALADGQIAILQARPITAMPDGAIDWTPPNPKGVYMRSSIVDLMPKPLSPLFITLGIPSFRKQMLPMGKRVIGREPVLGDEYLTCINQFAYMNTVFPPKGWFWILFHMIPAYPRLLRNLVPLWRDEMHPEYKQFVAGLRQKNPAEMPTNQLWRTSQEIVDATMYYVSALTFATMGASAGAEMLATRAYEKLAKREGDPPANVLLMGWDNIPVQAEKSLYDLAMCCREESDLRKYLLETKTDEICSQIKEENSPIDVSKQEWEAFTQRFEKHQDKFGHIIFQLDFAEDLPLDHPEPMLENIKMYLRDEGVNPHKRQQESEKKRIQTSQEILGRLKGLRRWLFSKALNAGQAMAEIREDALSDIGLGYPYLRAMLHELGYRFEQAGLIQQANHIYFLEKKEIDALVQGERLDLHKKVLERKQNWDQLQQETPPPMIPLKKRVMGVKTEMFVAHTGEQSEDVLKGVPASAGKVTAPACVLHGPQDFDQMHPGDVLVAGTTTPAWTPLFSMAAAVVTDIGGPLSHGSIVAREYGIPAVMGTGLATKLIISGQTITVDGNQGLVEIHQKPG